jgi:hypothetical protein
MGGSGGSYLSGSDARKVIDQIRNSDEQTENAALNADVSAYIADLLTDYNDRNVDQIQQHLESIKKALEKEVEGTIDLLFAGSVSRHTYVDGLSDVDALVILDNCDLANESPEAAKNYIYQRLQERFPNTFIKEGNLSVTVDFSNVQIQIVPAVKCNNAITISNNNGDNWSRIRPKEFAKALSKANEQNNGKLVPMIKMAKGINGKLPNNQQLTGYHIESLAIKIFKDYSGPKNTKQMLKHFFAEASTHVKYPIKDKTGQTVHTDDYLGAAESGDRILRSNALNRISKKMKNADNSGSLQEWKEILN